MGEQPINLDDLGISESERQSSMDTTVATKSGDEEGNPNEVKWEAMRQEVRQITDALGERVDPGIEETVIGLNLSEIPTTASCEGHLDHGFAMPWVDVAAEKAWDEMFEGEKQVAERVAQEYGIPADEVTRGWSDDDAELAEKANIAYEKGRAEAPRTAEYEAWMKENDKLKDKLQEQLDTFYVDRPDVPDDVQLKIDGIGHEYRMHAGPGGDGYYNELNAWKMTLEERLDHAPKLAEYQSEMKEFAEFLKEKYLAIK